MPAYIYREDSGYSEEISAADDEAAAGLARDLLSGGDWNQDSATASFRVHATLTRLSDGAEEDHHRVIACQIDPAEPACGHDWAHEGTRGHDWAHEGTRGHGGGVIIRDQCSACRLVRVTDTRATDRADGTAFDSVSYLAPGER